jgi:hypothetical protein
MKPGSMILNRRQKRNSGMAPSSSSPEERIQKSPSTGKVMINVFWDCDGVILVDAMPTGETTNSSAYIRKMKEFRKRFKTSLASQISNRNLASA